MSAIKQGYSDCFTQEIKLWKDVKKGFTHFAEGDVLVAKITPCFENIKSTIATNLKNGFGAGTTELHVLRSSELVVSNYLLFFCKSPRFINDGVKSFTGTAGQQRISTTWIKNYQIPLPPVEEQHRIVAKINELFSILDIIDAKQKSLEEKLKLIKNKALDLAIHGKLVPQLDSEPAVEQIGEIPDEIPFEIPEKWKWVQLKRLIDIINGTSYKSGDVTTKGIRIIRGGNLNGFHIRPYKDDIFLPMSFYSEEKIVKGYDIVIVASTGSKDIIGKPAVLTTNLQCQIGAFLRIIRPKNKNTADYLKIFFQTKMYRNHIRQSVSGTNINNIKKSYIEELFIPLPPLKEQHRIVAKINEIFSFCDQAMEILHK